MKKTALILLVLIPQLALAQESVSGFSPQKPTSGDKITVWYNPGHPKSVLSPKETIYASVSFVDKQFDFSRHQFTLELQEDLYKSTIPIPDDCMTINIYLYTASTMGLDWGGLEIEVYNKSVDMVKDQYPGYGYRNKWFPYPFQYGEDTARSMILEEAKGLEKLRKKDRLGVGYSLAYGYLLAGEEAKSRQEIKGLLRKYPDHHLTSQALVSYSYMVYAGKIDNPSGAAEMDSLHLAMVSKFPDRSFAQMYLGSRNSKNVSLELFERICRNWMDEVPDDSQPYLRLAGRYHEESIYPKKVIGLADKGIELLLQAKNRIYLDLKGFMTRQFLSQLSFYKASALKQLGDYDNALSTVIQSNGYQESANKKLLEGQIWMALRNYYEAESVLLEAIKLGSKEAEAELRVVHAIHDRSGKTFDEYLDAKLGKETKEVQKKKPATTKPEVKRSLSQAPLFDVISLKGQKLSLEDLRGKVVVLNFWNLGCGPCRAEMPDLNKLVEKYKGDDVVFIAFSNDNKIRLEEFFNKKEFSYQQVSDAMEVIKAYGIKSLPTHVIINPDGQIHIRMIGAGKRNNEVLDNILSNMLR